VVGGHADGPWEGLRRLARDITPHDAEVVIGVSDLPAAERAASRRVVADWLAEHLAGLDSAEALAGLRGAGIPAARARSYVGAIAADPAYAATVVQDSPETVVDLIRLGVTFDGILPARTPHVPRVGEHTRELLAELGWGPEVDRLLRARAV
jgi:crotonobetainyl-CoA:carnitine CoA-transferase CaiB-like acyl-CoA transferase